MDAQGVSCALIGAMALASHGVARTTRDVDILATDGKVLDPRTWLAATAQVKVDVRVGEPDDPLRGLVRLGTDRARLPVDVVVPRGRWTTDVVTRAVDSGRQGVVDGVSLPLVTLPDLVLLKADAAGTIDLLDIELVLEAWPERRRELRDYVEARLGLLDPYARRRWRAWSALRD